MTLGDHPCVLKRPRNQYFGNLLDPRVLLGAADEEKDGHDHDESVEDTPWVCM
jgi:hypothetical protein